MKTNVCETVETVKALKYAVEYKDDNDLFEQPCPSSKYKTTWDAFTPECRVRCANG